MLSRITRPTSTRTALNRNGSRHPHARNGGGVELADQEERDRGEADTGGGAHLREGAEEAAATGWCVFDGHQGGAAPLAADGEALHEPQEREQDRRGEPDHGVAGHQAHERGGQHPW